MRKDSDIRNNDFWIYCKTKTCHVLIIDIYDPDYMERPREERFSELKSLLSHDIMSVKKVYVQYYYDFTELKLKDSWLGIERIVEVHRLLERLYPQITPLPCSNAVLYNGTLELDERYDNTHLPHYKVAPQKRKSQRKEADEGEQYLKADGEVYTIVYGTECRVCELVWEAWKGDIPDGFRVSHIDGNKQNNRLDNLELVNA